MFHLCYSLLDQLGRWAGSRYGLSCALFTVLLWLGMGSFFGFSKEWQLFINLTASVMSFVAIMLMFNYNVKNNESLHDKIDGLYNEETVFTPLVEEQLPLMSDTRLEQIEELEHAAKLVSKVDPDTEEFNARDFLMEKFKASASSAEIPTVGGPPPVSDQS